MHIIVCNVKIIIIKEDKSETFIEEVETREPNQRVGIYNKWKNHFSEMKGDVGMSHHEKEGNKKMPIPRQKIIDNPIPTSLIMYYAAVLLCVYRYWGCNLKTNRNTCKCVQIILLRTKM